VQKVCILHLARFHTGKKDLARDNDLIDKWDNKRLNLAQAAKNSTKLQRMIVQRTRIKAHRAADVFKYGEQVPRNHQQAMQLDRENGNTDWQESEALEISQLHGYNTFEDLGHKSKVRPPEGYKKITLHLVYDVKHDGRKKSRIVAGGHLTETPTESVYSGVVSLR
jgi:hypothetical protein